MKLKQPLQEKNSQPTRQDEKDILHQMIEETRKRNKVLQKMIEKINAQDIKEKKL